jgi:hypothetical protein
MLRRCSSEKAPGMFGTIVVCLPSSHKGGWVKLQHGRETKVFRTDLHNPSYACWSVCSMIIAFTKSYRYSDVVHEITQVTAGYRFVLTFNLTADPKAARPTAAESCNDHGLRQLLRQWQSDLSSNKANSYKRLVHVLDHEYTEAGLKLGSLKGRDLDVVRELNDACNATGFLCLLASCEKIVSGGCEDDDIDGGYEDDDDDGGCEDDDDYGYSHRRGPYHFNEDGEEFHEITELCDNFLHLNRIVDMSGKSLAEKVEIDEEDFLVDDPFKNGPDEEDYSGFTGNEGVSTTHWYRDSVRLLAHLDNC